MRGDALEAISTGESPKRASVRNAGEFVLARRTISFGVTFQMHWNAMVVGAHELVGFTVFFADAR